VVRALVASGWDVHLLVRAAASAGRLKDLDSSLAVHFADLAERVDVADVVNTVQPSHIVHLGAATMRAGKARDPDDLFAVNFLGTLNLIDACAPLDYARFVNIGDAFEYGPGRGSVAEDQRCRPSTYDGLAELAATTYAAGVAAEQDKPIITLRCFSIYGPEDHPDRLVPRIVARAATGAPILLSRPDVSRDFLAVEAFVRLANTVLRLTGSTSELRWGAYPLAPHDRDHPHADLTKTRSRFGWHPSTSLDQGLTSLIRRVRDAA
jgi:nucleoside-diphosphate-sugar epimerase